MAEMSLVVRCARSACSKKTLQKRVPILAWAPKYTGASLVSDLIAGITVGLTVIPQGIAYAIVAKLPPQYGLYSAFMGCFVYCVFGSSKDITVGPTAIMALMTAEHAANKGVDVAVLLAFLSGCIIFTLGLLNLGFVIDFISVPVIAGFTSAAAITIASSQVKSLLGLQIDEESHAEGITGTWIEIVENIGTLRYQDTVLGGVCIVLLLLLRSLKNVTCFDDVVGVDDDDDDDDAADHAADTNSCCQRLCLRFLHPRARAALASVVWFLSTGRNAVVVILTVVLAFFLDPDYVPGDPDQTTTFRLTGNITAGIPALEWPPFSTDYHGEHFNFAGMVQELGSAIVVLPLIAILENMAIAKAFAGGKPVDASQEMIALGLCNLAGSFVGSFPTTGSFSRTAVNSASGVKTPLGGLFTGGLVLAALAFLMPACAYIPKASLAAVIITAVIFMVEYEVVKPMWKSKKFDLLCALATFLCCLFWALEYGILVGAGIQMLYLFHGSARPQVHVERKFLHGPGSEYLSVLVDRGLVFPSVNYVRNVINKAGLALGQSHLPVVVDCSRMFSADYTAAKGMRAMAMDFHRRGQAVIFLHLEQSVESTLLGPDERGLVVAHSMQELAELLNDVFSNYAEEGQNAHVTATRTIDPLLVPSRSTENSGEHGSTVA